mgnify:CR=1 FL=1
MAARIAVLKISRWLSAAILFILATPAGSFAAEKKNVLFLICDDLNCDLGSYGHPQVKSPNIDRLAERGVRFSRAYCQYPLCGPSRASFMTGLYPDQTTILGNAILLRERLPGVQSMSQMFIRKGYEAIRIGKIYHYGVPRDIGTDGHDDPKSWTRKFNPRGRDKTDESKVFSLRPGNYGGTLSWLAADGSAFDSSSKRGQTLDFNVGTGRVIRGWDEGILALKPGQKARLRIPSNLGYGARGMPPVIPPGADLIFDVWLVSVD